MRLLAWRRTALAAGQAAPDPSHQCRFSTTQRCIHYTNARIADTRCITATTTLPLVQERTRRRLLALSAERQLDSEAVSAALARAYHAVTREGVLH